MRLETRKLLYDVEQAAALIASFTQGRGLAEYREEAMLRSAVERHGYDAVSDAVVWDIVETKLPVLREELEAILGEGRA